jgi:hypothetical protein
VRISTGYWHSARILEILCDTAKVGTQVIRTATGPVERTVPALVDLGTFDKAQRVIAGNRPRASRNRKRNYLLCGLLVCGDPGCGCNCVGLTAMRTTKKKGRQEYTSYACGASKSLAHARGSAAMPAPSTGPRLLVRAEVPPTGSSARALDTGSRQARRWALSISQPALVADPPEPVLPARAPRRHFRATAAPAACC